MEIITYKDKNIEIRQSLREDVIYLSKNLRDEDLKELSLMGVSSIENSILFGYESPESACYTVLFEGRVVLMFGVVPLVEDETSAALWMLATDEVGKFKKRFLKLAMEYVAGFKSKYSVLFNYIHSSNKLSMKLVSMLGAEFKTGFHSPHTGEPFLLFLI